MFCNTIRYSFKALSVLGFNMYREKFNKFKFFGNVVSKFLVFGLKVASLCLGQCTNPNNWGTESKKFNIWGMKNNNITMLLSVIIPMELNTDPAK